MREQNQLFIEPIGGTLRFYRLLASKHKRTSWHAHSRFHRPTIIRGVYGPYSVDGFTKGDASALEWTATIEGWPTDPTVKLATVTVRWNTGASASFTFHGGPYLREDGSPAVTMRNSFGVPVESDGNGRAVKSTVASGAITIEVFTAIRTAITFAAIA